MKESINLKETAFYKKTLGCLLAGTIGDALGNITEKKTYAEIKEKFGWKDDFDTGGTDDTILRNILIKTLIKTDGFATLDDWAGDWLENWSEIFGSSQNRFWISVLHTAQRLRVGGDPRTAALGNIPCSSAAMCMSPVGIVNACDPQRAALQAYNLSSLINVHDAAFSQDGAAAIAAAIAAAYQPGSDVAFVIEAATKYLYRISASRILRAIDRVMDLAQKHGDFESFTVKMYEIGDDFFQLKKMNVLETIPLTLALFYLAKGNVEKTITYAANFGRDADTMAAMGGAIAGALHGVDSIPKKWIVKLQSVAAVPEHEFAESLTGIFVKRLEMQEKIIGDTKKLL